MGGVWNRWYKEYLTGLRDHHYGQRVRTGLYVSPSKDDIVLIDDTPAIPRKRDHWKLGRVVEVHKSPDGYIRVASVQSQGQVLTRPVKKLYPVEFAGKEDEPWRKYAWGKYWCATGLKEAAKHASTQVEEVGVGDDEVGVSTDEVGDNEIIVGSDDQRVGEEDVGSVRDGGGHESANEHDESTDGWSDTSEERQSKRRLKKANKKKGQGTRESIIAKPTMQRDTRRTEVRRSPVGKRLGPDPIIGYKKYDKGAPRTRQQARQEAAYESPIVAISQQEIEEAESQANHRRYQGGGSSSSSRGRQM